MIVPQADPHHLVLVHQQTKQALEDYQYIAAAIERRAPDIRVFIVDTKTLDWPAREAAARAPTLVVSPMPIKKFTVARGRVLQGFNFAKSEQYRQLVEFGIPIPGWLAIEPGVELDSETWGDYVVIKPDSAAKGAEIRIKRTGRVRHKPGSPELLAQRFVYTGQWPNNYRVVTLFGRALMSWHCEADHRFRPLEGRYAFRGGEAGGGITIVSNKMGSTYRLSNEADVIALAERAHTAFAGQPLLGTDIVRDVESGELFVLETNPRGDAWLMSSDTGRSIQADNGIDFAAQFGALDIAVEALISNTRVLAQ